MKLIYLFLIVLLFGCKASYETTDMHTTHYILTHGQWELTTDEYTEYFKFYPDYSYSIHIANHWIHSEIHSWNIIEDTLIIGREVMLIDSMDYRNIWGDGFKLSKL